MGNKFPNPTYSLCCVTIEEVEKEPRFLISPKLRKKKYSC